MTRRLVQVAVVGGVLSLLAPGLANAQLRAARVVYGAGVPANGNQTIFSTIESSYVALGTGSGLEAAPAVLNSVTAATDFVLELPLQPAPGPVTLSVRAQTPFPPAAGLPLAVQYRAYGTTEFVELDQTPDGDRVNAEFTLPAAGGVLRFVTLAGPLTAVRTRPVAARLNNYNPADALATTARQYRMVGFPFDLDDKQNPMSQAVFGNELGEPNSERWRMFRFEEGRGYRELTTEAGAHSMSPGHAFWLITEAGQSFDVSGQSHVVPDDFGLALAPGRHQVANPFPFAIETSAVRVFDGTNLVDFADARAIVSDFSGYDGDYQAVGAGVLEPWQGYFIQNRTSEPVALLFSPAPAPLPRAADAARAPQLADWSVTVQAARATSPVVVGSHRDAAAGFDAFDTPAWPAPPNRRGQLSAINTSVPAAVQAFATDVRPAGSPLYEFPLRLTELGGEVTIEASLAGKLPDGFEARLVDPRARESTLLSPNSRLQILANPTGSEVIVLVGETQEVEARTASLAPPVNHLRLSHALPNPSGGRAFVELALPETAAVRARVLDVQGRTQARLADATLEAGVHTIAWNGRRRGRAVAAGIYYFEVEVGERRFTRKVLLVR